MSVPYGLGASTLDYLVCHYGHFIGIETKAPGGVITKRQLFTAVCIEAAGGKVFVIDGVDKCAPLSAYLEQVKQNATSESKSETPHGGGAVRRVLGEFISPERSN